MVPAALAVLRIGVARADFHRVDDVVRDADGVEAGGFGGDREAHEMIGVENGRTRRYLKEAQLLWAFAASPALFVGKLESRIYAAFLTSTVTSVRPRWGPVVVKIAHALVLHMLQY